MTIEPQGWALITTTITTTVTVIVGRAMYVWGKTTDTRNRVATNKSDGELITPRSNAAVFEDLATIAREGAETQKGVIRVVQRNTDKALEELGEHHETHVENRKSIGSSTAD